MEVDLGARTAGPRVAHGPEVVLLAETQDSILRQSRHRLPEVERLVVVPEHCGLQPAPIEAQVLGEELPRELDRVGLEVVAEREVAEHLEERVMPRRATDVLEIVVLAARADALLAGGRAHIVALFLAEEHALELHHAGVGEEQRLVADRHERRRRHARVPVALEIFEKSFAELGARHGSVIVPSGSWPTPRRSPHFRCARRRRPARACADAHCADAHSSAATPVVSRTTRTTMLVEKPRRSR